MNWFTKALTAMRHTPRFYHGELKLKRTKVDYRREVGDGLDSSVVTAPIGWVQRALPEARLSVEWQKRDGGVEDILDHAMIELIQKPNPFYGDLVLWAGTVLSWYLDGNAYWMIVRNRVGRPVELWYVPHWMMEPMAPEDGSEFISHYRYRPGGGVDMSIDPEDVVHFRCGINPRNLRKGLSPLDSVLREIFVDLESSNFVAALTKNMGVPGVVISPKGGAMVAPQDVEATKTWFQESFGGDNRGKPLVMGAPTEVSAYGFNPQQMNLSEGRDVAEERVCAVVGIPAAVVGFGAGLQTSKVGATMKELHKIGWQNGVLPLGRALADELKRSLLPLFGNPAGLTVGWNTDKVPALQEEEDAQIKRWNEILKSGGVTVFEYRTGIGLEADDSHRIYLRPINVIEVPEGEGRRRTETTPGKAWGQKARASDASYKRGHAYALMLQRQASGLSEAFKPVLIRHFARWADEGRAAALPLLEAAAPKGLKAREEKADDELLAAILEKLGIEEWAAELTQAYGAHYLEVAKAVQDAAERAGLGANLPDPVARAIVASGGRRVGLLDLDKQTRAAVFDALAEGRAEGLGVAQLADRIADKIDGGPWNTPEVRAEIIARTETKYAQNISTIERARAAGVETLIVFDGRLGPGRSLESHMARNGSIVTIAEGFVMADAEHPNGTLSFAPHFEE